MIGPAERMAFPDAAAMESGVSSSSLLRRRPQICQSHRQISVLSEARKQVVSHKRRFSLLQALTWCSHRPGKAWWRSAKTQSTSSGACVWQNGKPQRKNGPSGSSRSPKLSSGDLYSNCMEADPAEMLDLMSMSTLTNSLGRENVAFNEDKPCGEPE